MWPHRRQPTGLPRPWDSPGKNTGVGCHFLLQCMKVKSGSEVAQSCPTLRDPMDCSPPGSSVRGIFQARELEWGAIAFSLGPSMLLQMIDIIHFYDWVICIPWSKKWQPTSVFVPGKSHGQWSLAGYSPPGPKAPDSTESLSMGTVSCGVVYTTFSLLICWWIVILLPYVGVCK